MLRVWNLSLLVATFALDDPRHVPHALGRDQQRARVRRRARSTATCSASSALVVVVSLGLIAWRGDRLRSPGVDRLARLAGGRVPRQQRGVHGVRLHRAARHGVPADRRGARRTAARSSGAPYFDRLVDADRHRPAVPDGASRRCCRGARPRSELLRERLFWPAWCGAGALARRGRRPVPTAGRRWSRSASPGSPPVRRCASSCSPPDARAGGASSGGPTAA